MHRRSALAGLLFSAFIGSTASAKVTATLPYTPAEVWSTAVRFLRIDRGFTIREKDAEAGYILFEQSEGERKYRGSLELVRSDAEGRAETKAIFSLPDLPRHFETLLADKLAAKVKEELGVPPSPPRKRPDEVRRPVDGGRAGP